MMSKSKAPLPRSFYERNTKIVAQELLGKIFTHKTPKGVMSAKIVETEAYFGKGDPGSHASPGKTPRSTIMFGEPGRAYVYFNYGVHYLFNVVTEKEGIAGAVLIRALEPVEGLKGMFKNRRVKDRFELTNGPAKLTQAFQINLIYNGCDLTQGNLIITPGREENFSVMRAFRIGLSIAEDKLLRYYIEDNPFVSKK